MVFWISNYITRICNQGRVDPYYQYITRHKKRAKIFHDKRSSSKHEPGNVWIFGSSKFSTLLQWFWYLLPTVSTTFDRIHYWHNLPQWPLPFQNAVFAWTNTSHMGTNVQSYYRVLTLECLPQLSGGRPRVKCPECRIEHNVPDGNVTNFPTNRYILENLEQRESAHREEPEEQMTNDAAQATHPMEVEVAEEAQRMLQGLERPTNREHPQVRANVGRNNRDEAHNPRGVETNPRRLEINNRETENVEIKVPQDSNHCGSLINCERCACRCATFWIILVVNLFIVLSIAVVVVVAIGIMFYVVLIAVFSLLFMCHIIFHIVANMYGRCDSCNCDGLKNDVKDCKSTFSNYHQKVSKPSKFWGKKLHDFTNYLLWLCYVDEHEDHNQNECCEEKLCPKIGCAISSLACFIGVTCASVILVAIFFPVRLIVMAVFCLFRLCCRCCRE